MAETKEGTRWWWRLLEGDNVRSLLALAVVLGGGCLLAAVWFRPTPMDELGLESRDPSTVITALFALISGVLGHYFGRQGVDQAQKEAERAESEKHGVGAEMKAMIEDYELRIQALKASLALCTQALQSTRADRELQAKLDALLPPVEEGGS